MARHEWVSPSNTDRIYQLELDMTMVHAAIDKMATKLGEIEQAIIDRDNSHCAAVEVQIKRLEELLGKLTNEPSTEPVAEQLPSPEEAPHTEVSS